MRRFFALLLISGILIFSCQQRAPFTSEIVEGTGEIEVINSVLIPKSKAEVFESYTKKSSLEQFLAPKVSTDLRTGIRFITSPYPLADLSQPGHVVNRVTTLEDGQRIVIKTVASPPYLPFHEVVAGLTTEISFSSEGSGTRVTGKTSGFPVDDIGRVMANEFQQINDFTFQQLKAYHEGKPFDFTANDRALRMPDHQIQKMIDENLWVRMYRFFFNQLVAPVRTEIFSDLAEKHGESNFHISFMNFVMQDFAAGPVTAQTIQSRYPFWNSADLDSIFGGLIAKGWFAKDGDGYIPSDKGNSLANELKEAFETRTIPEGVIGKEDLDFCTDLFSRVIDNAMSPTFSGIQRSIKQKAASPIVLEPKTSFTKISDQMATFIAFINDMSHYRMDLLAPYIDPDKMPNLSPESVEVLYYAGSGNPFDASSVADRSNWKHSIETVRGFMQELVDNGMATWQGDDIVATEKGIDLNTKSSIISSKYFYVPFLSIAEEDLKRLLMIVPE